MKISTRLKLAVYVPVLMAVVVIVALVFSYLDMGKIQKNGDTVRQIRSSITELNHFVFSYILYHEERPKQQFLAENEVFTRLIANVQFRNSDQQRLLDSLREDSVTMNDLFLQLVSNHERGSTTGIDELQGAEDRLVGLLLLRSYQADADAALLRSLIDDGIRTTETRTTGLILLVIVLATVPLTIVLARTTRGITSSLSYLNTGAAVIGSGNLDFRIEEKRKDEIGDLTLTFNRMTANLKTITASKVELEGEITERKRVEEELRQRTVELKASNKELEAFAYSVSHDLRAPLRSMEGFSSALIEDYADKLDNQGKQYLKYVQESSDLMARLIDDLLKLSRVTRSDMSRENVDLSEIAQKIVGALEKVEPHRHVKVSIAPDITAYGDLNLLRVALENLLGNAWKFSSKTTSPRIEVGTIEHNGRQAYFVRDNGVGFDMKYADKLFQPFQRLHKSSEFAGTGIGLATVQRIIRRHGGEVWAESNAGEGATFYFTLG
jgi:signal transduction histidine kinase